MAGNLAISILTRSLKEEARQNSLPKYFTSKTQTATKKAKAMQYSIKRNKILGIMKDIPNFEGIYAVTDDGEVYSYPKKGKGYQHNGIWLAKEINKNGYVGVRLQVNKKSSYFLVHRLVANTFINNKLNKRTVNHKNGIRHDNRVSNLEWATHSENTLHSFLILKTQSYEKLTEIGKIGNAKRIVITQEFAEKIYKEYNSTNTSYRKLAEKYNVGKTTIERIITGKGQMYFTNKLLDEAQNGN